MSKKKLNLIIGILLVAVGIILILCGAFPHIIDYLLGGACCAAAIAFVIKSVIATKKVLTAQIFAAAILLAAGITLFVLNSGISVIVLTVLNYSLLTVGVVILIDTIIHFVKKRKLVINVVELVMAIVLLTIGIVAVIPETIAQGIIFYFSGAVVILAGLVVVCASLINFSKYAEIPSEPSKAKGGSSNNTSNKNKKKSHK